MRGGNKEIRSNTGRNRININGAMNFHQPHEVTLVESERINAQSTKELFVKLLENTLKNKPFRYSPIMPGIILTQKGETGNHGLPQIRRTICNGTKIAQNAKFSTV
jgi:hypothetical protein